MIQVTRKNNFTVQIHSRNHTHTLLSDVSEAQGGDDLGMTPHELLESALGACTSITVQMYAARKSWPLETCDALVEIASEGNETVINVRLNLQGMLDEEQKKRLYEIANKCPVHKILAGPVRINLK